MDDASIDSKVSLLPTEERNIDVTLTANGRPVE
jgi:hypothetical protein